jgi:hypothetical protein
VALLLPTLSRESQRRLYAWLCLSVASLVGAGLLALFVAMARTPGVQDLLPGGDYFRHALVGHVNLAVVVWFLAFQGALWTLTDDGRNRITAWGGIGAAALGVLALTLPAFLGWGVPILSNYVPMLTHPLFPFGLLLFAAGIGLAALGAVRTACRTIRPSSLLSYGGAVTAGLVLVSLVCFGSAAILMPAGLSISVFYEKLAWGGGHILQFANTAAMVLVWLILARLTLGDPILEDRWAKRLLGLYLIVVLPAPLFYFSEAPEIRFTLLMAVGLGPVTGLVGLMLLGAIIRRRRGAPLPWSDPGFAGLVLSLTLFGLGGLISLGIRGSNVVIPAHYHAVIGAVTLAFMALSYRFLPLVGRKIWNLRLASWQPYLYGTGQALFVLGLFWAGLRDVPRKTFGVAQQLHDIGQIMGMGLMGIGGLVAILGGMAFILNMVPSLLGRTGEPESDLVAERSIRLAGYVAPQSAVRHLK